MLSNDRVHILIGQVGRLYLTMWPNNRKHMLFDSNFKSLGSVTDIMNITFAFKLKIKKCWDEQAHYPWGWKEKSC